MVPAHVESWIGAHEIEHVAVRVVKISRCTGAIASIPCLPQTIARRLCRIVERVGVIARPTADHCLVTYLLDVANSIVSEGLCVVSKRARRSTGKQILQRVRLRSRRRADSSAVLSAAGFHQAIQRVEFVAVDRLYYLVLKNDIL